MSATLDSASGRQFVSIVNAHRSESIETTFELGRGSLAKVRSLSHADPFARNTFEAPRTIVPVEREVELQDGRVTLALPPHSYTIVELVR